MLKGIPGRGWRRGIEQKRPVEVRRHPTSPLSSGSPLEKPSATSHAGTHVYAWERRAEREKKRGAQRAGTSAMRVILEENPCHCLRSEVFEWKFVSS
ncbi:hypothetical protein KM043_014065 [Ampulex compressa]|nr:hypothetical protein KM043_014065 [Ampulex compressa]